MKILFHIHSKTIGGYEVQLGHLATTLESTGHSTYVLCPEGPVDTVFTKSQIIRYENVPDAKSLLSQLQPHLLLTLRGPLAHIAGAAKQANIPTIWVCGYRPSLLPDFDSWRTIAPLLFNHIFVPSELMANQIRNEIPGVSISTLPCAVDLSHRDNRLEAIPARSALGYRPADCIVGYAARLAPHKRHLDLVRAIQQLRDFFPVHLLLVGWTHRDDRRYWDSLLHTIECWDMQSHVRFVTALPNEVPYFLKAMDVFVSPAENEGMGCAVLEAIGNGIPVVSSSPAGCENLIKKAKCGLTFPVGDVAALTRRLSQLLTDGPLRAQFRRRGPAVVRQQCSIMRTQTHFLKTASSLVHRSYLA